MVNEVVLNYLKSYFGEYSIDKLKEEIVSKGYSEKEFDEALNEIKPIEEKKIIEKPVKHKPQFKKIPPQPVREKKVKEPRMKKEKKRKVRKEKLSKINKPVKEKKKAKVWPWILLLIVLAALGVIILNYYGTSVLGLNIFRVF